MASGLWTFFRFTNVEGESPFAFTLSQSWSAFGISQVQGLSAAAHASTRIPGIGPLAVGPSGFRWGLRGVSEMVGYMLGREGQERITGRPDNDFYGAAGLSAPIRMLAEKCPGGAEILHAANVSPEVSIREAWQDFAVALETVPAKLWRLEPTRLKVYDAHSRDLQHSAELHGEEKLRAISALSSYANYSACMGFIRGARPLRHLRRWL